LPRPVGIVYFRAASVAHGHPKTGDRDCPKLRLEG